jgi:hypothetical protein
LRKVTKPGKVIERCQIVCLWKAAYRNNSNAVIGTVT